MALFLLIFAFFLFDWMQVEKDLGKYFPFSLAGSGIEVYNCGRKWEKTMFYGQKEQTIDEKNRLVLPSLYRNEFQGGTIYATLGLDNCIELFPAEVYEDMARKYAGLEQFDPTARKLKRAFLSNTFPLQIDSHSRVLLPRELTAKVGLTRKVTLVGMMDHVEIWDKSAYDEEEALEKENFARNAQELIGSR